MLVNGPLTNFKTATEKLSEHYHGTSKSTSASTGWRFHQVALWGATTFHAVMENQAGAEKVLCSEPL